MVSASDKWKPMASNRLLLNDTDDAAQRLCLSQGLRISSPVVGMRAVPWRMMDLREMQWVLQLSVWWSKTFVSLHFEMLRERTPRSHEDARVQNAWRDTGLLQYSSQLHGNLLVPPPPVLIGTPPPYQLVLGLRYMYHGSARYKPSIWAVIFSCTSFCCMSRESCKSRSASVKARLLVRTFEGRRSFELLHEAVGKYDIQEEPVKFLRPKLGRRWLRLEWRHGYHIIQIELMAGIF